MGMVVEEEECSGGVAPRIWHDEVCAVQTPYQKEQECGHAFGEALATSLCPTLEESQNWVQMVCAALA